MLAPSGVSLSSFSNGVFTRELDQGRWYGGTWFSAEPANPHGVSLSDWERFIDRRSSGAIDPRGNEVAKHHRRAVGNRSVEADCDWLRWVFNWASKWRTRSGHYLMRENPIRGFEAPEEKNPRRPVATQVSTAIESCTGLAIENVTLYGGDEPLVRRFLLSSCSLSLRG